MKVLILIIIIISTALTCGCVKQFYCSKDDAINIIKNSKEIIKVRVNGYLLLVEPEPGKTN